MKTEGIKALLDGATPGPHRASPPEYDMAVAKILDQHGAILGETTHHGRMREDAALWAASPTLLRAMLPIVVAARRFVKTSGGTVADLEEAIDNFDKENLEWVTDLPHT